MIAGPDFIIIGAMKCATSTLHEQLAANEGFFMSRPKEPNFFSDDAVWERGLDWYAELFAGAPAGALRGESSTHYTKLPMHPRALDRLASSVETRRFVYVMRHPVDRLISHYIHEWSQGVIDEPLNEAVERRPELVAYGCYAMQLAPWLERFGRGAVLPVFAERFSIDPQAELERVGRFLGSTHPISWRREHGAENVSSERIRRSPLRSFIVRSPLLTILRRALIPEALRAHIKTRWQMRERPVLSAAALARVERTFDADLAQLGAWLGAPFSCATFSRLAGERAWEWNERA